MKIINAILLAHKTRWWASNNIVNTYTNNHASHAVCANLLSEVFVFTAMAGTFINNTFTQK